MLGESNLKAKDYESAVMFFKKYYQLYPKGSYMELSRYNTGYSLYKQTPDIRLDQSSTMEAIKEFQNFLDYCPETTLKEQAHQIIYDMQDKLVQKEYPETSEENMKKIKEYLFRATIDDCERILNAFLRFGVKEIFEAVG